jgi:hypothetical protein
MAKQKRPAGIGERMQDLYFEIEDPDGNTTVMDGATDESNGTKGSKRPAAASDEADGIDWAKVAREAAVMVELNKAANDAWRNQSKPKEEDA